MIERIGSILRIIRIPVIASGIYSLGFAQGAIEVQKNPYQFEQQMLETCVKNGTPGWSTPKYILLSEKDAGKKDDRNSQLATVATEILNQARPYVQEQLEQAKAQAGQEESDTSSLGNEMKDRKVIEWTEAQDRICGSSEWTFCILDTEIDNAWVTELLPYRIFITSGLLNLCVCEDEVAFVVSHELSHLILGHNSRHNDITMHLKTLELVLLALDPTEGLVAFLIVGLLSVFRAFFESSYSRQHERQADILGLQIMARTNYDLESGSKFLYRVHKMEEQSGFRNNWFHSHPSSLERARSVYQEGLRLNERKNQIQSGRKDT